MATINRHFGSAFVVSLKRRSDRREHIARHLAELCIPFEFVDAIDGIDIERDPQHPWHARLRDVKAWTPEGDMATSTRPKGGRLGCALTHLEALHRGMVRRVADGGDWILILEDDVVLCGESDGSVNDSKVVFATALLEACMDEIKDAPIDVLMLGSSHQRVKKGVLPKLCEYRTLTKPTLAYGGFAYAVHRRAWSKLYEAFTRNLEQRYTPDDALSGIEAQDVVVGREFNQNYNVFALNPAIAGNLMNLSDLTGWTTDYAEYLRTFQRFNGVAWVPVTINSVPV